MKRIFISILFLLGILCLYAQSPNKMSYQCIVRNSNGVLVTNQGVGIRISILQGTPTGALVYQETYNPNPQSNANGLVNIEIGGGLTISGEFSTINWAIGPYFLKTETDPTGGTNYTIIGTSQLLSVPYAMYAKTAGNGFSGNYNDLINKPTLFNGTWANITGKPMTISGYGITDAVTISGAQTIVGNKTFSGTTTVPTPINTNDAVTKAYVDAVLNKLLQTQAELGAKDIDGNTYKAVKIGNQVWMAENLRTTKFNDGTTIPLVRDNNEWDALSTPAYCWYNNDEASYKTSYGALYNWYTVNTGKLCSTGWHVPTDAEWTILTDYLGGQNVAGGKLKETGMTHWIYSNSATNESGFTGLPSGIRYNSPYFFSNIGSEGSWWSSTELDNLSAYCLSVYSNTISVRSGSVKYFGLSVRCLRDN